MAAAITECFKGERGNLKKLFFIVLLVVGPARLQVSEGYPGKKLVLQGMLISPIQLWRPFKAATGFHLHMVHDTILLPSGLQ